MNVLDIERFAPQRLDDLHGLSDALGHLQACWDRGTDPRTIITKLSSIPNLFCYIVSVWPNSKQLITTILELFPNDGLLIADSFAGPLLLQLSHAIFSLPAGLFLTDTSRKIGQYTFYVKNAFPVLASLRYADFDNRAQKTKGQSHRKNVVASIDDTCFRKLGCAVPLSTEDAMQTSERIAAALKEIMQFYLHLLQDPELAAPLRDAYIPAGGEQVVNSSPEQGPLEMNTKSSETETGPVVYPLVQSVEVALHFDNADEFGEWRILMSTRATKTMRYLRRTDATMARTIIKKIKELSYGHFSKDNQKRLNGLPSSVPIFTATMQRGWQLVYQVDCIPTHGGEVECQVIKVYEICEPTELNPIWGVLGQHLGSKGEEYRRRCTLRNTPLEPGGDMYLPLSFPPGQTTKQIPPEVSDKDKLELHSILVLEKYETFSQAFLNGLIAKRDTQHVFELTLQEYKIIQCKTSCYVLGRSGTGKTTSMIFKMLGVQRAWELQGRRMSKPRQIFVTKSKRLARQVEKSFTDILLSEALADYTIEELAKMKVCEMGPDLFDVDDTPDSASGLPQKYSELSDHHFPLFITFGHLVRMIAADVMNIDDPRAKQAARLFVPSDDMDGRDALVTYNTFAKRYWPRLCQNGLDSWLVFSELIGTIEGSEKTLASLDGCLGKDIYCNLSSRTNPTFAHQREAVYNIFEAYRKHKRQLCQYDVADRTHAILKTLIAGVPLKGQQVDYLYVDEVQDNLLLDALVLRFICRNPNGLFWAGDTAQTISEGSSFRFNDLKAFLYRIEADRTMNIAKGQHAVPQPSSFELMVNYRSHSGIVNCAHTVIEVITRFWPNAIDHLQPEHGIVDGWKPLFSEEWGPLLKYLNRDPGGGSFLLGAKQCVLVRDDKSLKKFCQQGGNAGEIMTIYESKGMEFNDVFLYNFFEDSPIDFSRWRIVLGMLENNPEECDLLAPRVPSFERDESRYAGICSELKLLYVAVTRAKKNLVIIDDSDKSEPMKMLWTSRRQIQRLTSDIDGSYLRIDSNTEELADFGRSLFDNKNYKNAMHYFERACRYRELKVAEAFHQRELARSMIGVTPYDKQRHAFRIAARAFSDCATDPGALENERRHYYRNAAECYARAGDDIKAAEAYVKAEEFELAARRYRKVGQFEQTWQIIVDHSDKIPEASLSDLRMVCRLWFTKENERSRPSELFSSYEEELEFLEEYDLDVAQLVLLESHEKFFAAAELHLSENRPLDAIRSFLKEYLNNKDNGVAVERAGDILLENLWRHCSLGVAVESLDDEAHQFFAMIEKLPLDSLPVSTRDQILMFKAGVAQDVTTLDRLITSFQNRKDDSATLWALDRKFSCLLPLVDATLAQLEDFLQKYYTYARLLYLVASHNDAVARPDIRKLLAITEASKDNYVIHPGALLLSGVTPPDTNVLDSRSPPPSTLFSRSYVMHLLRNRIRVYLRDKVDAENKLTFEAKVFSQCLSFIVNRSCNYVGCPQEHVDISCLDVEQYNARIGVHLQQMRILQLVYSALPDSRRCRETKENIADWLNHLYEAFFPPIHAQGSIADLDWSTILDAHDGLSVMKEWTRAAIYALNPLNLHEFPETFLNDVLRLTKLSFAFNAKDAWKYITKADFYARYRHPLLLRTPNAHYIVEDMVASIQGWLKRSIWTGIDYVHHMLQNNLHVNLSVLCDCAEDICSSIVIALSMRQRLPLHNLVLPRRWLIGQYKLLNGKYLTPKAIHLFLDDMQTLLEMLRLESAEDVTHFWLEHTKITVIHRNVFVGRICRMLCILAHNAYTHDIRDRILRMMSHLRSRDQNIRTPYFYRRYAEVMADGYLQAVLSYDNDIVIEDLVHLVHRNEARGTREVWRRIKRIEYQTVEEISGQLSSHLVAAQSGLRVDAPEFIPHRVHAQQGLLPEGHREDDIARNLEEQPENREPNPVDDHGAQEEPITDDAEDPSSQVQDEPIPTDGPSQREIEAAQVLQVKYRKRNELLCRSARTGVKAERYAIFEACLKQVQSSGWQRSPYRLLYLGPLPHLLLGLDKGIEIARAIKGKNKKRLTVEGNEKLEEIGRQLSEIGALLKRGHNLRSKLDVESSFHNNRDVKGLKQAAIDVKNFVEAIPGGAPVALQEVDIAYKAIVCEKAPPKKTIKPVLNTEDLDPQF